MRKIAKAAAALAMGCVLLSTSAFAAMVDNINEVGYLDDGVFTVELTELGAGESTIIVLPAGTALEAADEKNILYINQQTIEDGAATYTINLGADFNQEAVVYAGGTNMSAVELGTLKAPTPVQSVTLTAEDTELEIGETATITVAVLPEDATYKTVEWSENVVPAEDGLTATFTAETAGTFEVTATTPEGVVGRIEIVVKPAVVSVTDLTLTVEDAELEIGETTTITAEVIPADATDKTVEWSDNVTVAADGVTATFEATEAGTYTVTATAGGITKEVVITVAEPASEEPTLPEGAAIQVRNADPYEMAGYSVVNVTGIDAGSVAIKDADGEEVAAYLADYTAEGGIRQYVAIVKGAEFTTDSIVWNAEGNPETIAFGDGSDLNGTATIGDVSFALNVVGEIIVITDDNKKFLATDIDGNGTITIGDVSATLNLVGEIDLLPGAAK